jgi:hypothetical protein
MMRLAGRYTEDLAALLDPAYCNMQNRSSSCRLADLALVVGTGCTPHAARGARDACHQFCRCSHSAPLLLLLLPRADGPAAVGSEYAAAFNITVAVDGAATACADSRGGDHGLRYTGGACFAATSRYTEPGTGYEVSPGR